MPVITLDDVSKKYKRHQVLSHVNLTIEEGVVYGLVGPNGSGKSVLLRLMSTVISPDQGSVTIDPAYLSEDGGFPEQFGIIIDRPGFIPTKSGLGNLTFLASLRGVIGEERYRQAMTDVGLDPDNKDRVSKYSLGMRQRLALAQAVMEDQKILLLDEPFNAMDTEGVQIVRKTIRDAKAHGRTVVFTTHDQREIESLSDVQLRIENRTITRIDPTTSQAA
jgi:ABC-2 type transport system ATP-binding protein